MDVPSEICGLRVKTREKHSRATKWELAIGDKYYAGVDALNWDETPDGDGNVYEISALNWDGPVSWKNAGRVPDLVSAWAAIIRWVREQEQRDGSAE